MSTKEKVNQITERHFAGVTYYLLTTYPTKEIARAKADNYRFNITAPNPKKFPRRFARVIPMGEKWAVWVSPLGEKS